ncbi:dihydrolipoamide dehydrogenase [Bacillus thermophilus]|uniref:Dihydrolipoyl dehydrogenase n=1 Tax=Siminovitchia thermophila TaxID=1245522 RepID=A0ABS2R6U4_9BACI|nr:FAD-dependent oxidoreductase [Siminovitchia thermophila]MBM7715125.1 dihydrolipoamide dehydrogenase [Siminovitchia thermophila]ONK22799.1 hypothetical protein BLX87_13840 [Bacillus sp. VT-16-64]
MVVGELVQEKELVVVGGGPAGYTAAIRAAQLGKEVVIIEKEKIGGVCLNKGCIPSKTLVHAAKQSGRLQKMKELGFLFDDPSFALSTYHQYKNNTIDNLRKGVMALCKAHKIEIITGKAYFLDHERIGVENGHQYETIKFSQAIIAAGAYIKEDETNRVLSSYQLFNPENLPGKLLLIGWNYLVLEAAFAYSGLGCDVTVLATRDDSGFLDAEIEKELIRLLKKRKIDLHLDVKNIRWHISNNLIDCTFNNANGERREVTGTHIYSQEEIRGNTDGLGVSRLGVELDDQGFIVVDEQCRTNRGGIFAIGDVTGPPLLAVKGIRQGKTAAEIACGKTGEVDMTWMPTVIHTDPPIAFSGFTESEAKEAGFTIKTGVFPLTANGYASLTQNKEGMAKVVFDDQSDRLLGVHFIGEGAVDLISSAVLGLEMGARDEDFLFPFYPHPSTSESLLEAVEQMKGLAIHQPPKKVKQKA